MRASVLITLARLSIQGEEIHNHQKTWAATITRSDGLSPRAREYHATTDKKPQHSTLTRRQDKLTVTLQLPGCMPSPYMPSSKHWFVFAMHAPSAPCARPRKTSHNQVH